MVQGCEKKISNHSIQDMFVKLSLTFSLITNKQQYY